VTLARKQSLILAFLLIPIIGGCGYKGPLVLPEDVPNNKNSDVSQPEIQKTPTDSQDNNPDEGS
jgi:predicted small lipoprotein YifL